ncbi:MAG TPA: NAD(P)H-dependent oxidoreductase [Candidatus Paceibacterota bacterium]|nr:NAD(P)H-dependent oxidoreductase [Candidatus Paceibacterota bacterium]
MADLNVLVLNASLKHGPDLSNTEEVAQLVLDAMRAITPASSEIIRLSDKNIPVGLRFKESEDDEWPEIVKKIIAADVVIFATPIWWGGRSSLMQRVIERMDAFDEEVIHGGRSVLLNKVAGIVVTGSEDGAQAVMAGIMEVLSFLNFTLPPQCCTYWVGEVGMDPATDRERRLKNGAVQHMAQSTAKNLVQTALLLKEKPLT